LEGVTAVPLKVPQVVHYELEADVQVTVTAQPVTAVQA